jgi:aldehyde oxidoreductase
MLALHMPPALCAWLWYPGQGFARQHQGIDTSEAEKMPGVVKVITWKDVKGKNAITGLITFPTNKGDGWDRPILCKEKVFQFGDAIAIVPPIPKNMPVRPRKGQGRPGSPAGLHERPAALAPDAMEIHPGVPNVYYEQGVVKGEDTKPFMAKAAHTVERKPIAAVSPTLHLEPDCGAPTGRRRHVLTIQSKSIGLHLHHAMICPGIGVEPDKLRMVQNGPPAARSATSSARPWKPARRGLPGHRRPVSLVYDQFQNITYTGKRSPGRDQSPTGRRQGRQAHRAWKMTGGSTTVRTPNSAIC